MSERKPMQVNVEVKEEVEALKTKQRLKNRKSKVQKVSADYALIRCGKIKSL